MLDRDGGTEREIKIERMQIELIEAGKHFSHVWALRNISARFESGKIYAVLGANGAGKSTLLKLLAGWLPLTNGQILIDGMPLRPTAARLRRNLMLLADERPNLALGSRTPLKSLARNIEDYRADHPGIEDEVADWCERLAVISLVGRTGEQISKGQAYKLAMIELFVIAPPVWLLDEPFSAGLDAAGLLALENQIRQHANKGGTVIFSSQWPEHAKRLADQAFVLHEGTLVWNDAPQISPPVDVMSNAPESLLAVLKGLG